MKFIQLAIFFTLVLGSFASSNFTEFTLFPNPIQVGQTAYIRAVASLPGLVGTVTSGTIKVDVSYNGDDDNALQVANIPLCDSTPSIVCSSLRAGDNAITFSFDVPEIPVGIYTISITAVVGTWGSISQTIVLNVTDPNQVGKTQFYSFIQAQVSATAQYENSNIQYRTIGDAVQIGPIGYAPQLYSVQYDWGRFLSIAGSPDVVEANLDYSNFVWGLYGNLTEITYSSDTRNHTYTGAFYVGYASNPSAQTALDFTIVDGTFSLTWSYKVDSTGSTVSTLVGSVHFNEDYGTLPSGWSAPITVEKYGTLYVSTDVHGVLTLSGNKTYCYSNNCPTSNDFQIADNNAVPTGLSDEKIILIVCLTVGIALVASMIVVMVLYLRRRKRFEEEDGIFSATRKPEYGNALVVDDIIQETREHGSSPIIPNLDRHPGDTYDDEDDDDFSEDMSEPERGRQSRFSRDMGSPSRRRSPSIGRKERGSGRHRSRSNSPEDRRNRRSMSPPHRDDESSYYSDAGSSASRVSSDDE